MFRIGQKVVCVEDVTWMWVEIGKRGRGPKKNEICTIVRVYRKHLVLHGYPEGSGYNQKCFRPLDDGRAEEVLENVLAEVKENELVEV